MNRVAILGASSGPGAALFERLLAHGRDVVGLARSADKMAAFSQTCREKGLPAAVWRQVDALDREALAGALEDIDIVIVCAGAYLVARVLDVAPHLKRLIALGSARIYTRFPDPYAESLKDMVRTAEASPVPVTILHPTMIYGARGENNVNRIVHFIRTLPVVPLPGGGRALIQPIHCDDVAACLEAALERPELANRIFDIAGPRAMPYADFIRACARAAGLRVRIVSLPVAFLLCAAPLSRIVPGVPAVSAGEVRRLLEDKAVDIRAMRAHLGITPRPLEEGLAEMLAGKGK